MMDDISLPQLRAIATLARTGTIAAAADQLGYTPGAVSQQLAALEQAMGAALLVRTGRRVELTDAGRALVEHASQILNEVLLAREAVTNAQREVAGSVDIGIFATSPASLFADAIILGRDRYPHLDLRSREIHVDDVADAVRRFEVDLALGIEYPQTPLQRPPAVRVCTLVTERFAIGVSPAWAPDLVEEAPLDLTVGRDWPWVLPVDDSHFAAATRHAFRLAGFEPRILHGITDTAATLALVESGVAATLTTPMMAQVRPGGGTRLYPLHNAPTRELILLHRTLQLRPTVAAAMELIAESAATAILPGSLWPDSQLRQGGTP